MAYNAVQQRDHDLDAHSISSASPPNSPSSHLASPISAPALSQPGEDGLFLDHPSERSPSTSGLSAMVKSISSRGTKVSGSYDMIESEDYEDDSAQHSQPALSPPEGSPNPDPAESFVPLHIPRPRPRQTQATVEALANASIPDSTTITRRPLPHPLPPIPQDEPVLRTASGHSVALRHPTPDLQTLQGAYTGNIRNLEATAERLSMTSSIEDAIRDLHMEQKRTDSRRSSLLSGSSLSASQPFSASHEMPAVTRQASNTSIIEMNKISRSGGTSYTPAGFIKSPRGSLASKSSRYGSRPEPELEGRPLDSFVTTPRGAASIPATSPVMSRSASIAEMVEETGTMTRPITDIMESPEGPKPESKPAGKRPKSPTPSASTFDQAQKEFADFDGVHTDYEERSKTPSQLFAERTVSQLFDQTTIQEQMEAEAAQVDDNTRRVSSGNRLSMPRPTTYADPDTGQQMVYYPAPVPMMLNLPQKLSKMPSAMARNKRRTQVMSSLPLAARQSAIWLPDVLEGEGGALAQDPGVQGHEYVAQHQRMSMGGRRTKQDLQHLPPQLLANAFFEQPSLSQTVELKEQSAVATLDSILDASAYAPVSAFTDHAFAGHLGSEVYGKPAPKNKSSTQLLGPGNEQEPRKRLGSFNLFKSKRASSGEHRSSTMPNNLQDQDDEDYIKESTPLNGSEIGDFRTQADGGLDEEAVEDGEQEQGAYGMYRGAPTTLLAELQLRKQQQKYRTRPTASAYPNGMHSTLLEMDSVMQVEQKSRKQGRIRLAWEGPAEDDENDDEDVPLAVLYATKAAQEINRPLGLMERKERDDNEPLSARRDRLQARRPGMPRSATMVDVPPPPEYEDETLAQRIQRLKAQGGTATGLPTIPVARPVSGEFASEMMSQFGGDLGKPDIKGKGKEISTSPPPDEEEETLGQRRKRLQAEREARAKEVTNPVVQEEGLPAVTKRRSMADILQAHPAAGANRPPSYGQLSTPTGGLLGLHEQQKSERRSSTMLNLEPTKPQEPTTGLLGLHEQQKSARRSSTMLNLEPPKPQEPTAGLLGLHEQYKSAQRSSMMLNLEITKSQAPTTGFQGNIYNQGGIVPAPQQAMYNPYGYSVMYPQYPQFAQPSMNFNMYQNQMTAPFANPYAMGYSTNAMHMGYMPNVQANPMASQLHIGNGVQPLKQGQIDMVERWRQSIMQ